MKFIIISFVLLLMLFGCTSEQPAQNDTNNTTIPEVVKNPTLKITSPIEGDTINTIDPVTDISLSLSTTDFIVKSPGGEAKIGEGHFRVTLDSNPPETVTQKNYVLTAIEPGEHTIKVELYNNNRRPYSPTISQTVKVTIKRDKVEYQPKTYTIKINDYNYEPASLDIKSGDIVTFINNGKQPHSATSVLNGVPIFDTKIIASAQNSSVKIYGSGSYEYYSATYRAMTGKINVASNQSG